MTELTPDELKAPLLDALLQHVRKDNIEYHGLAGHLLLKGIPHVLKVRITADMEKRVKIVMQRDGIPADEARVRIQEDDRQRRKWTHSLYDHDPWDVSLYDLTICIDKLSVDNAVDFICRAAAAKGFQATEKSLQQVADMAVACRVKAALVDDFPNVGVTCEYGNVLVYVKSREQTNTRLTKQLSRIRENMEGIHHLETHAGATIPSEAV